MCNLMVLSLFDIDVVTLTFKIFSGLYSQTIRCKKLILDRNIGWGVGL